MEKRSRILSIWLIAILLVILSWESIKNSIVVPLEYAKNWNQVILQKWIGKNIPESAKLIASSSIPVPVRNAELTVTEEPNAYFIQELQDEKIRYAIIGMDYVSRVTYWWMKQDTKTSLKFWDKPTQILSNTPIAQMMKDLKKYIIFESLNPWQAPDSNFIVVEIPPKQKFSDRKLIYEDDLDSSQDWVVVNDGFGDLSNFKWDPSMGYTKNGSLLIQTSSKPTYSQKFVSKLIPATETAYSISGVMKSSKNILDKQSGAFIGINFLDDRKEIISTILSSRIFVEDWTQKEIIAVAPQKTAFIQIFFQAEDYNNASFWLDNIKVFSGKVQKEGVNKIRSHFDLNEHLFFNSHGGL